MIYRTGKTPTKPDTQDEVSISTMTTEDYYEKHAREYFDATSSLSLDDLYPVFLNELPKGGMILDAGSGSGRDTKAFRLRGYNVVAIEPSEALAGLAEQFTGQLPLRRKFLDLDFHNEFDGIWACASLLHVPKCDIVAVIDRLSQTLKREGVMFASLKEGCGEHIGDDGRYFAYYSPNEFRAIMEQSCRFRELAFLRTAEMRSLKHTAPWIDFVFRKVDG
jgi:SAM-dependent methyltransferase